MSTLNTKSVNDTERLQYLETHTVEQFKKKEGISSINILPSQFEAGKYFFAFAGGSGQVSKSFNKSTGFKDPRISKVRPPMDATGKQGEDFLLFHEAPNNDNVVMTY